MRYIADSAGYVKEVSFGAEIACGDSECVEYTGTVPEGYTSLEDWFNACGGELWQWMIVDGNLTLDPSAEPPADPGVSDSGIIYVESVEDIPEPGNTGQIYLAPATSPDELKLLQAVYPVGAIYLSTVGADPGTLFGFGTWERLKDVFLLAAGDTYAAGATGGEAAHTLTVDEIPSHAHGLRANTSWGDSETLGAWAQYVNSGTLSDLGSSGGTITTSYYHDVARPTGGGAAHNNMPPYLAVYTWRRTA